LVIIIKNHKFVLLNNFNFLLIMKKILLGILFLGGISLNAQVFSEGFEEGFPGQMTTQQYQGTTAWTGDCLAANFSGGATCPITGTRSATFFVNAYTATAAGLRTPQLNLTGAPYLLKFKHIQRTWQGDINVLLVRLSNDNGANWVTMAEFASDVQTATERVVNLGAFTLSATSIIEFAVVNNWGYSTVLDDIEIIENTIQNDLSVVSYFMDPIVESWGQRPMQITVRNNGGNVVSSFDYKWQVNNGTIYTQSYTNIGIQSGALLYYTHQDTWNDLPGSYVTKVWVDNVNGQTDATPANNEITRNILVSSGSTDLKPFYEKFTSSTCGPCASFNNTTFNPFYDANNQNFTLVNYQVNWPGTGDPYYTAETGVRVQYYQINAAPTLLVNGRRAITSAAGLNTELASETAKPAFFQLYAAKNFDGENVTIDYSIVPYLSGNYTLHAIVFEKLTSGNVASNGETSFKNVSMKMAPNATGTPLTFVDGETLTGSISTSVTGTFVEELSDLDVVVFIQNNTTQQVFQSAYATNGVLSNENVVENKTKVYPNPTNGLVNISIVEDAQLTLMDITGKVVKTQVLTQGNNTLNLETYQSGIYFAKIKGANIDSTEKIIVQ
jgi:hypothetical protein